MDDLFLAFWWFGPVGLGVFFAGVGILLWGISKFRRKQERWGLYNNHLSIETN